MRPPNPSTQKGALKGAASHPTGVVKKKVVPLGSADWYSVAYGSILPNKVFFSPGGIKIQVRSSASPLIYSMAKHPLKITEVTVKGYVNRLPNIHPVEKQGEASGDDFTLRLGLVLPGSHTLNWYQKLFAPGWILKMHSLAPRRQGIDYIYFLNAVLSPALLGKSRTHPLSTYIKEYYVWLMNRPGVFSFSHKFPHALPVVGLWLASDGDDTGSTFDLEIHKLVLSYF